MTTPERLTVRDVAAQLGKKEATVRAMVSRGKLPAPDGRLGRTPWWRPDTIAAWEQGQTTNQQITDGGR